jgi:hypothetical protein
MVTLNRKYPAVLIVGLLGLNCRDSIGPGMVGHLAFAPTFNSASAAIVAFDRLRITLVQPPSPPVLDTIVPIPPTADSVDLTLSVPLSSSREDLLLYLRLLNSAGDTVFRNTPYPQPVTVTSGGVPAVVQAPIVYVGVGFDAVGVSITTSDTSVLSGDALQLAAAAFDAQGQMIPGTPVAWRSLDSARARVPDAATGRAVGGLQRGPARIVAELLTGPADTILVAAQPVPAQLVVRGGGGQSGGAGQPLELPLEVEVRAADNLPVSGVSVRFSAPAGSPADTIVVSDSVGRARVFVVLGPNPGQQVFHASLPAHGTVAVVSFTFTAVAKSPARSRFWTASNGGNWSDPANWSGGIPPGSADTVFITLDGTYTVTVDVSDTIAFLDVGGGLGVQTVTVSSRTLGIDSGATFGPTAELNLISSTLNGASGTLVNRGAVTAQSSVINPAFANNGRLTLRGTTFVNGLLTTQAGSTLRVEGDTSFSSAFATIDQGFVNKGVIELTSVSGGGSAHLTVSKSSLVNATGATVDISAGAGGSRTLDAMLDNQGSVQVNHPLTIGRPNALHTNRGTIDVVGGDLTINQSGGNPAFINSAAGIIGIAAGRTVKITAGNVTNDIGARILGSGTLDVAPATFSSPGELVPGASTGILTVVGNAQLTSSTIVTIELAGPTEGAEYDQVRISGDALLAGVLNVTTINGFNPAGNTFIILRSGNLSGTRFEIENLPAGCSQPVYSSNEVQFTCS